MSQMIPPDMLAALGGGAGAGDVAPQDQGGNGGGPEAKPIDLLKQMLDLGQQYIQAEPDEEDKATMAKVLSTLQSYLAKDQKENDAMLGGAVSPRGLRKALGGSAA